MKVYAARIVERDENTDEVIRVVGDNYNDGSAHIIADKMYRQALIDGRDVYYKVELYEVEIANTAGAVLRFVNQLRHTL